MQVAVQENKFQLRALHFRGAIDGLTLLRLWLPSGGLEVES